jgi:tetratricopeptide (TPR) repeat protein
MQVEYLTLDDGIKVNEDTINEAKKNIGEAFFDIGFKYHNTEKDYSKALAWNRLAENQNYSFVYNNIGNLYSYGLGVSRDDDIALEYYLKAAGNNIDVAMGNVALRLLNGEGVPVDKYKALEFYIKCGKEPEHVKKLNDQGVHLKLQDKSKLYYY